MKNLLIIICMVGNLAFSQAVKKEVLASSGTTLQNNDLMLEYTLGELAVSTLQNLDFQLTQGFHQPELKVTHIISLSEGVGEITVYPNPTSETLNIRVVGVAHEKTFIRMLDVSGRIMWEDHLSTRDGQVRKEVSSLAEGIYYIHVLDPQKRVFESFLIQKR